ncbi:hypothetical protein FGM00_07210 [Aggregatimonas sangjinii]|uniref:Uncharacterized protein n=1 Tax=Aggregatimonas sangjinii TaxID=2583587 RepID=A0A5B7SSB4_9FLAO|nr:hypothetical protein [Aggregatimonas sangjinii]QCW99897.1 hypothetical protein FGM00_07210 [Aggregatimonas sangjinii]
MILNQREKSEILELLISKEVDLRLTIEKNVGISIKHPKFEFIIATIKRSGKNFELDYFQSTFNNTVSVVFKDFASLKHRLSLWFDLIKKDYPSILQEKDNIKKLSRRYYKILEEAIIIKNIGFEDSSGMIFRKALEILIKDYFLFLLPSFEEKVLNNTIGRLITYFYEINNGEFEVKQHTKFGVIKPQLKEIKSLCKKIKTTFKLGNDFAHYERRMEKFNTSQLHSNILKIEQYIDFHMQEEFVKDMKAFLNAEFDSDEQF